MNTTDGAVLYRDGTTQVTTTQATVNGTTYPLDDIATISIVAPVLRRTYGYVLAAVGLILLIVGYLVWGGVFLTPMFVGAVLLVAGIALAILVRTRYLVLLKHRDAHLTQLYFPQRTQAEQFTQALNQTINRSS